MVPADRPLLSFTGTSATDANKAALPKAFTRPDEHNCAADTTRIYLGELFVNGLDNPEVSWHWAPIVSGAQPAQPTLGQPEFSVAGTLRGVDDSGDDVEFVTMTLFDSLDAVRLFAGEDYQSSVVLPEAEALLSRFDKRSRHYRTSIASPNE